MSFEWIGFLKLAEGLYCTPDSPGPQEAAFRSAVSRAYYAALHCAADFAYREGFRPSEFKSIHEQTPTYFRDCKPQNKTRQQIATQLNRLRGRRVKAGYDDVLEKPATQADAAIETAKSVLGNLESLAGPPSSNR